MKTITMDFETYEKEINDAKNYGINTSIPEMIKQLEELHTMILNLGGSSVSRDDVYRKNRDLYELIKRLRGK